MAAEIILGWLGNFATVKLAETLLNGVSSKLKADDLAKALKVAAKTAQEGHPELFYHCEPDFVPRFLENFFQSVCEELQKPLKDEGIPNIDFLGKAFIKAVREYPKFKDKIDGKDIKPWLITFINVYFQTTNAYLKFQVAKENYFNQLINHFDDVKFAGIAVEGQEIDKANQLAQIFVMPEVAEEARNSFNLVENAALLAAELDSRQSDLIQQQRQLSQIENQSGRKLSAEQLFTLNSYKKAVLLGVPGSGKSTLLSYFTVILASYNFSLFKRDDGGNDTDWLPILIPLRNLARERDSSILEYVRKFAEKTLHTKPLPEGFFEYWLEDGRVLILLDGLDEVAEETRRYKIVQLIENFLHQYNQNYAIITSRPAGYRRDFFRTEEFTHYWLQPFDDTRLEQFIHNWYASRISDIEERERRKDSLKKALDANERIKLLARNPLLLTIIALIHRYQARLPKERYKLYDKAVETLLTNWDAHKEITNRTDLKHLQLDDLRRLMEILACWIHCQGSTRDEQGGTLIDRETLIEQLGQEIKTLKQIQLYQAKEEAKCFLNFIRERTGLLNEQGTDCYAFVHKTFQEYLCTQEIIYQADNEGDFDIILNCIRDRLHDAHWREVLLLLIAQQKPKKAAKAIQIILKSNSEYESWLHRDLFFAGACLAENPKNLKVEVEASQLAEEIINKLVQLEVRNERQNGFRVSQEVFNTLCNLSETDFDTEALELIKLQETSIDKVRFAQYQAKLGEPENALANLLSILQNDSEDGQVSASAAIAINWLNAVSGQVVRQSLCQVVEALRGRLDDQNFAVHVSCAIALGKLGNVYREIINTLVENLSNRDISPGIRSGSASALGRIENLSETQIEQLREHALNKQEDFRVRSGAIYALNKQKKFEQLTEQEISSLLQDENSDVRSNASTALINDALQNLTVSSKNKEYMQQLLELLSHEDSTNFGEISEGDLSYEIRKRIFETLKERLFWAGSHLGEQIAGLWKLYSGDEQTLLTWLEKENSSTMRSRIAYVLGYLNTPSDNISEVLLTLLNDSSETVVCRAAYALVNLGKISDLELDIVVQKLLKLIESGQPELRSLAVAGFGKLNNINDEMIQSLLMLLNDPDPLVVFNVISSLGQLGKKSDTIKPAIIQWLEQHQEQPYIGSGIDALWDLVTELNNDRIQEINDPILPLIGTLSAEVIDIGENHDRYLGSTLQQENSLAQ